MAGLHEDLDPIRSPAAPASPAVPAAPGAPACAAAPAAASAGDAVQRRTEVLRLFEDHPDALAATVDAAGLIVPWPDGLPRPAVSPSPAARSMLDLVLTEDHAAMSFAWETVIRTGTGKATVRLLSHPDRPVRLLFADLRATDGVVVAVVPPETVDGAPVRMADIRVSPHRYGTARVADLGATIDCDDDFARMLGVERQDLIGARRLDGVLPADQPTVIEAWMEMKEQRRSYPRRWRFRRPDGRLLWIESVYENRLDDPEHGDVLARYTDVTEEMEAREALEAQEHLLHRMAQVVPVGLFQVDTAHGVVYANERLHQMLGTAAASSLDELLATVVPGDRSEARAAIDRVLSGRRTRDHDGGGDGDGDQDVDQDVEDVEVEVEVRPPTGTEPRRCQLSVRALTDRLDQVTGAIVCVSDVTEVSRRLLRLERDLVHHAFHDTLTGLPNRTALLNRLDEAVAASREAGSAVALLLVDLDGFKSINDGLGHSLGDELLRAVSDRLRALVRSADLVARVGGDEFAILLDDYIDPHHPRRTAEQLLAACSQPYEVDGHLLQTGVSIGIATNATDATNATAPGAEELLRDVDLALHRAKAAGRGRCETYDPDLHLAVLARLELERSLRRGIEEGEMRLVYQPIHDVTTGALTGVEALVRWQHPVHGLVLPSDFIPLAEETGLIVPLGRWVLVNACAEAAGWADAGGHGGPRLSVNLSSRQMASATVLDDVEAALDRSGLDPGRLTVEITESVLMESTEQNLRVLEGLRNLGVAIAIDDFGTGYSSLAYLQRLPVDVLKIDKAFVDHVAHGGRHAKLVKGILALSHDLGLTAVAEGIETSDQLAALDALGCPGGQGYLFSRPVGAEAIRAYIGANHLAPEPD